MANLKVGDRVRWSSSGHGKTTEKVGTIIFIAEEGTAKLWHCVGEDAWRKLRDLLDGGTPKFEYPHPLLVRVERYGARGQRLKDFVYSPRPHQLRPEGGDQ